MKDRDITFGKSCYISISGGPDSVTICTYRYSHIRDISIINLHRKGFEKYFPSWIPARFWEIFSLSEKEIFELRIKTCLESYTKWAEEFRQMDLDLERAIIKDLDKRQEADAHLDEFIDSLVHTRSQASLSPKDNYKR